MRPHGSLQATASRPSSAHAGERREQSGEGARRGGTGARGDDREGQQQRADNTQRDSFAAATS